MERIVTDANGVRVPQQIVVVGDAAGGVSGNSANTVTGQAKIAVSGTRVQLPVNALGNGVVVKANTNNSGTIMIGSANVTTANDGAGNGYPLQPGEAISFGINALASLYINGLTVNDSVAWAGN